MRARGQVGDPDRVVCLGGPAVRVQEPALPERLYELLPLEIAQLHGKSVARRRPCRSPREGPSAVTDTLGGMDTTTQGEWFYFGRDGAASSATAGHTPATVHLVRPAAPHEGIEPPHRAIVFHEQHSSTHTLPPAHPSTPLDLAVAPIVFVVAWCYVALRVRARRSTRAPPGPLTLR